MRQVVGQEGVTVHDDDTSKCRRAVGQAVHVVEGPYKAQLVLVSFLQLPSSTRHRYASHLRINTPRSFFARTQLSRLNQNTVSNILSLCLPCRTQLLEIL